MRLFLTALGLVLTTVPAFADDLALRADVDSATIYASGAEVTRLGTVTVPAGSHRIVIPMMDLGAAQGLRVTGTGAVQIGALGEEYRLPVDVEDFDTEAQAAARLDIEEAEDRVAALDAEVAILNTDIRAAQIQLDYLNALTRGGPDGVAAPSDAGDLVALLAALGQETARAGATLQDAQAELRDLSEEQREAQLELQEARAALAALTPYPEGIEALTVDVTAAAETEVEIAVTYLTDAASWGPDYEMALDTEIGELLLTRTIVVAQNGPEIWDGIDLTVSTADPNRPRVPTEVDPRPARIQPPAAAVGIGQGVINNQFGGLTQFGAGNDAVGVMAPMPVVAEDARATANFRGMSLSYAYPTDVTLVPGEEARLLLDELTFEAETENRAAPRFDDFAFVVATMTNDTGEPILPGQVRFLRDGDFLGSGAIGLIPAGAEQEIAFGPVDGLPLEWRVASLNEGDAGMIARLQTRTNEIVFTVENTTPEEQEVTAFYAVPFSEQEDLELSVEMSLEPSRRDVDGERGVHAWDLMLAPGEEVVVTITVALGWPEDQDLTWQP